jgi:hypothetical protein
MDIRFCPVAAIRRARQVSSRGSPPDHPFPGDGLGEPDAVAAGLADVGVVHQPAVNSQDRGIPPARFAYVCSLACSLNATSGL